MTVQNRIYDLLFYVVIGTVYAFALSVAVLSATILEVDALQLLLACTVFILAFYFVFYNRYTSYVVMGLFALGIVAACASLIVTRFQAGWLQSVREFFNQVMLITQKRVPDVQQYSEIFSLAFAGVFAFLTALNLRVAYNFPVLALMGVAVTCVPVYMQWGGSNLAATLFVMCLVVLLCKSMNLSAAEAGKDGVKTNASFALAAIPLCALILAVSWLLPKPEQLLEGLSAPQRIRDAADSLIYDLGTDTIMTFSEPGQELGGPVEMNDRPIMEVYADERVFLTASVRDTYTGTSWTISERGKEALSQPSENWYLTSDYPVTLQESQLYYMRYYDRSQNNIQINMMGNRTKTIFTPPFKTGMSLESRFDPSMDSYGVISLDKPLERYASYSQEYISFNWNNAYFVDYVLRGAQGQEGADANYLALPAGLPDRVGSLAAQLTADQASNYDKVQALCNHLMGLRYTLEPESLPRGEDFVDYFLFEGQEGYCVYFATALAVMARTLDIPARYVEGYVMPEEPNANGGYTVTGSYAHAWTEVFFPGFGWVPFDPTPGFYLDVAGGQEAEQEEVAQSQPEPEQDDPLEEEAPDQALPDEEELPEEPEDTDGDREVEDAPDGTASPLNDLPIIILTAVAILLLSVLFVKAMIHRYHSRFGDVEQMPNREVAQTYFSRFLMAAEAYGYPLLNGETAHAYASRIGGQLVVDQGALDVGTLAEIFSRASYSQQEVSDSECATMRRAYWELVRSLREGKLKGPRFYISRYILMRF